MWFISATRHKFVKYINKIQCARETQRDNKIRAYFLTTQVVQRKNQERKKNMKFTTIFPLLANCEMLGFSRGVMEGEYKKCECNTR